MKPHLRFWSIAALGAFLDLISKSIVFGQLEYPADKAFTLIPGFLDLRCTTNAGGVFGILQSSGFIFIPLSFVALAVVYWFFRTTRELGLCAILPLALIMAGTVGNLFDRVFYGDRLLQGRVRDFIDLHVGSFVWPTFNLADTFICTGSAFLIFVFAKKKPAG